MKTKQALRLATLAGLGTLAAAPSIAADATGYFYGGLGVVQARADLDQPRMASQVLGAGLTVTSLERDERDTAYKVFGGYQFTPNFGLEAGYFDLGQFGLAATTTPAGTLDGQVHVKGFNLDLVGTMPLSDRFSVLGRIGALSARSRDSYSGA
jgi:OOP family OmpA-OmpF porin